MRKFTLVAVVVIMSGAAMAQNRFGHRNLAPKITAKKEAVRTDGKNRSVRTPIRKAPASANFLPTLEEVYNFMDNEWIKESDNTYTYDNRGNILRNIYDDGEQKECTETEYNSDNQVLSKNVSIAEDNDVFENSTRQTFEYDYKVKDLVVDSREYTWTGADWGLVGYGRTWTRNVSRDKEGRVLGVTIAAYYMGEFEPTRKTTVTYNAQGVAETWKYEELTYDYGTGDEFWEEYYVLKDMKWKNTDGQIMADDINAFFTGANRLESAVVYEGGEIVGTIEASYEDNGNYSYTFNYSEPLGKDILKYTLTDDNGSYTVWSAYFEDGDEDGVLTDDDFSEGMTGCVKYDDHGNIAYEDESILLSVDETELMGATRYDYTYNPAYDYPVEQIHCDYNFDMEEFEPFLKVVSSGFVDVTTSIGAIEADASGGKAVYSIQGVKLGSDTDMMPAGIYIVKNGSKTVKMVKRQ